METGGHANPPPPVVGSMDDFEVVAEQPHARHQMAAHHGHHGGHQPALPWGLQRLAGVNQIVVRQKVELLEAFTGFETHNKYMIYDVEGRPMFKAEEENDFCTLCCCGPERPFEMAFKDEMEHEGIHLTRPFRSGFIFEQRKVQLTIYYVWQHYY